MRLYRWLLHLYPARFREEYGRQMEIQFRDDYHDAVGFSGKTTFLMGALHDLFVSIPGELAREGSQDLRHALRIHRKRKFVTASAGVYGMAAQAVSQRTKEIGARLALGANVQSVRAMMLRQTLSPLLVGLTIGVASAFALGRFVEALIQFAERPDSRIAMIAAVSLILVCALSVWRATARVLRIDPMQAPRVD